MIILLIDLFYDDLFVLYQQLSSEYVDFVVCGVCFNIICGKFFLVQFDFNVDLLMIDVFFYVEDGCDVCNYGGN